MKDLGKFKERYDFSLDSRQLGIALFAALVGFALVFVLGMSLGRQIEKKAGKKAEQAAPAAKTAAPAPQAPAAPDATVAPVEPVAPVAPVAPGVDPSKAVTVTPERNKEEHAAKKDDAAKDAKDPKAGSVKTDELTFPKVLTADKAKPAPLAPAKPAGKKPEPGRKTAAKPSDKKAGEYTVQVGAYKDEPTAAKLAGSLKKKGYDAYVHVTKTSGGGSLFRVQVGSYKDKTAALSTAKKIESSERIKPYVTLY